MAEMSWAFPGAAISRFTRSQTEHNAGVLFDRRSARARMPRRDETKQDETRRDEEPRRFVSRHRIENFSCSAAEALPCETKDLLFSTYRGSTAALDSTSVRYSHVCPVT